MTMGTTYQVKIAQASLSQTKLEILRANVDSTLREVNRQMSTYDPDSEISKRLEKLGAKKLRADLGLDPGIRYQGLS